MKKLSILIITVAVTTIVSLGINHWYKTYQLKTKYLDIQTQFLDFKELSDSGVEVVIDSNKVQNLHRVDFWIYNFNNEDIENLTFYLELFGEQDGETKVYSSKAYGQRLSSELVTQLHNVGSANNPSGNRFGYTVKNAKKGNAENPTFYATFLIDAPSLGHYNLVIENPGYESRHYEFNNYYKSDQYPSSFLHNWWGIVLFFAFFIGLLFLIVGIVNRLVPKKRTRKKLEKTIPEFISVISTEKKGQDVQSAVDIYEKINNKYEWENTNAFERFIQGQKKP